jgi:Icc protein
MVKKPSLKFVVLTDTHIKDTLEGTEAQNFDRALKDILANSPDCHGIMHAGDITDSGERAEFEIMEQIWKANREGLPPIHFTYGNHDVRWKDLDRQMSLFAEHTGIHHAYYDLWLEGYHFIFLGTEIGLKDCAYLSETQLMWLDQKLSEHEVAEKPAFIFVHEPLLNTVAGSQSKFGWNGIRQDAELKTILAKHPQSIVFTGHTHWELGAKETMYNKKYATLFNAASVAYLWTDDDVLKEGSQGFFVEVYEDRVIVKGRDFSSKSWVTDAEYTVQLPVTIPVVDLTVDPDCTLRNPAMNMNKSVFQPNEQIEVTYVGSLREDAFGIYLRGAKPSETEPISPFVHVQTKTFGQPDGKLIFSDLDLPVGSYDMIYLGETLNTELTRLPFDVVVEAK